MDCYIDKTIDWSIDKTKDWSIYKTRDWSIDKIGFRTVVDVTNINIKSIQPAYISVACKKKEHL